MDHLQTEARNPASAQLDELSTLQFVRLMLAEDAKVVPAVLTQAEKLAEAVDVVADRLRNGGRLIYIGAGTSGRLGVLDASECPPTFNVPPGLVVGVIAGGPTALTKAVEGAEDHPEFATADLAAVSLSAQDVLVGIATSGRTPYVLAAVDYARGLGAFTIGLACNADAELNAHVDIALAPVVGPEVLSGSTRLKSGTATKLVLNILSTGAMVRLGKTYGNLMVDLRATNEKLKARTNRIVREATGLDRAAADALLELSGHELKTALVSRLAAVSPDEARSRLTKANGRVRVAIGTNGNGHHTNGSVKGERLVLGIDGGGTGTVAILALQRGSDWKVLGKGEAGPSNRHAVGTDAALASLDAATDRAFAAAGLARRSVRSACLGLAGAGRLGDRELILDWAARAKLAESTDVREDAALLLAAGTPEGWGVAVVAGTGSMALGRSADGRTARAGGWGATLGDEGSGYAVALAGLRAVVRAADGRGGTTSLTVKFLHKLRLEQPQELVAAVNGGCDKAAIAALAPLVLGAADDGDRTAERIVSEAADELAAAVGATARALDLGTAFPVALAGGLLVSSPSYRVRFVSALAARGLSAVPAALVHEPAEGAVRIALDRVAAP